MFPSNEEASETHQPPVEASPWPDQTWLPYTLRWVPLSLILTLYLLLGIAVIVVHAISSRNSGLVPDDGSSAIAVGTKFVPTLLAVVSGLLAMILLDDVKRTEPFARLASPSGATAKLALTWTAETWWSALYRSFPSPLGRAKWALPCVTIAFVLGFLIISPLSSALFISQDITFKETTRFSQLDLKPNLPLQPAPLATTYFRTISNILRNLSTSAWITDDYVALPFWPGNLSTVPLAPVLSKEEKVWVANTTIFSLDLECEPMQQKRANSPPSGTRETTNSSLALVSPTGCTLKLNLGNSSLFNPPAGEIWSGVSNITNTRELVGLNENHDAMIFGCSGDEMLILTRSDWSMTGQVCRTTYYIGSSIAMVVLGTGQSVVTINESEYHSTRTPITPGTANITAFDNIFLDSNWTVHRNARTFGPSILANSGFYSTGPANLLSAFYQFFSDRIMADTTIKDKMQNVKRQFFGEVLRNAFDLKTAKDVVEISGSVLTTSRRVIVVPLIAITLEIVILAQAILVAIVFYLTRISRRPLGLVQRTRHRS